MSEARAVWMDLPREEHEFQFNPQRAFPNFKDAQEKRTAANAKARSSLAPHLDLPYGEHKLRRLDIFPAMSAEKAAPVHVFVHGGYWRAQDKENFAFVATELAPRGITTVVINYELCPSSTLDLVADFGARRHRMGEPARRGIWWRSKADQPAWPFSGRASVRRRARR